MSDKNVACANRFWISGSVRQKLAVSSSPSGVPEEARELRRDRPTFLDDAGDADGTMFDLERVAKGAKGARHRFPRPATLGPT